MSTKKSDRASAESGADHRRECGEDFGRVRGAAWQTIPLGEALTFQRGFDITKDEQRHGPYPVISSSGPKSLHAEFKVRGPGVIIGRKGSLGTVFFSDSNYWPHDTTLWIRDFHGNHPRFAFYILQTMGFERLDAGASNPSLNRNHIHTIPVLWPPLPIQQRIAGILSAYDELIENSQRRIKILEAMAGALYREWFVHFRFPGHENHRRVASSLGEIPWGWEVKSAKEILARRPAGSVYRDTDAKPEGDSPVIDQSTSELMGFHDNPPDHNASSALPMAIFGDHTCKMQLLIEPFSVGPNVVPFVGSHEMPTSYVFYAVNRLVNTQEYKRHWIALTAKDVIVANHTTAQRFATFIQPMLVTQEAHRKAIRNLRRTRDLLLPRLLSGQIEVEAV